MNPFLFNKKIDLVDFGDLKLFMFKDDNLYNIAVAESRKNQSIKDYQRRIKKIGYPASPVNPQNIDQISDSRYGTYLVLNHLWNQNVDFAVLDIGSHIGDFGLKIGNSIRTFGQKNQVVLFDPTEAGALVSYNIELNGLSEIVRHENLAVGDYDGLMLFTQAPGFSDSSHLVVTNNSASTDLDSRWQTFREKTFTEKVSSLKRILATNMRSKTEKSAIPPSFDFIVRGVDILHYLEKSKLHQHLFAKIDIEGFDTIVIDRLLQLLPERLISMIFEFAPRAYGNPGNAIGYLKKLSGSFCLFDLYYSPNPTRFRLIEPDNLAQLVADVEQRTYAYTDIFALDRRTPQYEMIRMRLSALEERRDEIVL